MEALGVVGGLHDEDQLGIRRQGRAGVEHQVKVTLVAGRDGLALVAAVLLLTVDHVAGKRGIAGGVGGVGAVLQGDGQVLLVGGGVCRGGSEHAAARLAGAGGRGGNEKHGVLALGDLLGRGANDVGGLVDRVVGGGGGHGAKRDRLAGGLAHGVGHHVKELVGNVLVDGQLKVGRSTVAEHAAGDELLRDVALGLALDAILGDDAILVLEHDDGLVGALLAKVEGRLVGQHLLGVLAVGVGVVEELDLVHDREDAAGGVAHAGQGLVLAVVLLVELVALHTNLGGPVAADLVDGSLEELIEALGLGEVLNAVGTVAKVGGAQDLPVGGDHAVPAGVAKDAQVALVVGAAPDGAEGLVVGVGDAVVGHDGRHLAGLGLQVQAAIQERDEVGVEVVAREDVVLARVVVVVAAALDGAGAHIVLEHDGDGVLAPALVVGAGVIAPSGLHAAAKALAEVAVGGGVLADGAAQARPDDVGTDIDLGSEVHAGASGTPGAAGVATGLLPEVGIEGRDQAVVVGDVVDLVRVGGVHVRDAVRVVLLAPLLNGVDPRDGAGVVVLVGHGAGDAGTHALLEGGDGVVIKRGGGAHEAVVPHERDDLVGGQLVCQGLGAHAGRLAPVLVEVQLAVAVGVAEGVAVNLDDLGLVHDAQLGAAVLVGDLVPAVAGLLGGPLCLDVVLVGVDGVLVLGGRGQRVRGRAGAGAAAGQAHQAGGDGAAGDEAPARDVSHGFLPCSSRRAFAPAL